ncbi:MAG: preprotein translocase subunit YajC [Gammaproteobacteria bacterium]|nr:preprotein translocase subunit YajC [Gammaproteobacteria bacterium]
MSLSSTLLDIFISSAQAADAAPADAGQQGGVMAFLPMIVIFVIFYFLLIRPQTKRAKEHKAMVSALAKGDEVVVGGGMLGRVTDLDENMVTVEISSGVLVKFQRHAVLQVLPKGTIKGS